MAEALAGAVEIEAAEEPRKAHQLPDPTGYKILIAMPEPDEKTEGGIIKSANTLELEEVGSVVGMVIKRINRTPKARVFLNTDNSFLAACVESIGRMATPKATPNTPRGS